MQAIRREHAKKAERAVTRRRQRTDIITSGDNDKPRQHSEASATSPPTTTFLNMKRALEEEGDGERPTKVQRFSKPDIISKLSEELLVRILSFVPVPSLLRCQR